MSELMNVLNSGRDFRWQLLTSVSTLVLLAAVYGSSQSEAAAQDTDRPTIWIELGAQSEQVSGFGDPFTPPFTSQIVADGFTSPLQSQHALSESFGGESKISFQPENSDWFFSASVLYGRANGRKTTHEETPDGPRYAHLPPYPGGSFTAITAKFSETRVNNSETHAILDFQAGKDVGLGLFGSGSKSLFSFGLRFAQFTSKQVIGINADPDFYFPTNLKYSKFHHTYAVTSHMERSFRGLGPSGSWNASALLIGTPELGEVTLDWGANAAVLFGKQNARGHHQTTGNYYKSNLVKKYHLTNHIQRSGNPDRSRTVVVPNLGGFAGASINFSNAKVSLGYRADFFFGAMDGGIDTRKSETRSFYGPFASVSVGLGG